VAHLRLPPSRAFRLDMGDALGVVQRARSRSDQRGNDLRGMGPRGKRDRPRQERPPETGASPIAERAGPEE